MVGEQRSQRLARAPRTTTSACPCTVRGSPSQRTGCWHGPHRGDVAPRHGRVVERRPPAAARAAHPDAHPQQPQRDDDHQSREAAGRRTAPGSAPASAMIIAANSTNEASSSNSAAAPTRHGPGTVGTPPAVVIVEAAARSSRSRQTHGRPSGRAGARLILTHSTLDWAVPGEATERPADHPGAVRSRPSDASDCCDARSCRLQGGKAEEQGAGQPADDGQPDQRLAASWPRGRAGRGVTLLRKRSASATKANGTASRRRIPPRWRRSSGTLLDRVAGRVYW